MLVKDHLGNEFVNTSSLCEHYKITYNCLYQRLNVLKWDLEKALTTPVKSSSEKRKKIVNEENAKIKHPVNKEFCIKSRYPSREYIWYLKHKISEYENSLQFVCEEIQLVIKKHISGYKERIKKVDTFHYSNMDLYALGETSTLTQLCSAKTIENIQMAFEKPDELTKDIYVYFTNAYNVLNYDKK